MPQRLGQHLGPRRQSHGKSMMAVSAATCSKSWDQQTVLAPPSSSWPQQGQPQVPASSHQTMPASVITTRAARAPFHRLIRSQVGGAPRPPPRAPPARGALPAARRPFDRPRPEARSSQPTLRRAGGGSGARRAQAHRSPGRGALPATPHIKAGPAGGCLH